MLVAKEVKQEVLRKECVCSQGVLQGGQISDLSKCQRKEDALALKCETKRAKRRNRNKGTREKKLWVGLNKKGSNFDCASTGGAFRNFNREASEENGIAFDFIWSWPLFKI